MSEPRTATVNIFVHKPLEIEEPDWCAGHPDPRAGYQADISHDGPEHVIAPGGRLLFKALLTQAPFSSIDRTVGLYVEFDGDLPGMRSPEEVEQLADDLTEAAAQLRELARGLAEILAGGGQ